MADEKKVIWTEGIILGQQHFQQWDRYYTKMQVRREACFNPYNYGLLELEYDLEALSIGEFILTKCKALLPNGQYLDICAHKDETLCCYLPKDGNETIPIYIATPVFDGVSGISGYPEQSMPGWNANYEELSDQYDPNRICEVMLAKRSTMLLTDRSGLENFHSLKIAEIKRLTKIEYIDQKHFLPSCLALKGSANLRSYLLSLINMLKNKLGSFAQSSTASANNMLVISCISQAVSVLEQEYQKNSCHPEVIYKEITRLFGGLKFLDQASWHLPEYQHDDLSFSLHAGRELLEDLINKLIPRQVPKLELKRVNNYLHVIEDLQANALQSNFLYLGVKTGRSSVDWQSHFTKQVKVSAIGSMEQLINAALPGNSVQHCSELPDNFPAQQDYVYFNIQQDNPYWREIVENKNIAFYIPGEYEDLELELVPF